MRFSLLLAFCLLATAAAAQEPERFLIETITVSGVGREAARGIIVAESLLREGESYSEDELRKAVYRVKRLPFVVEADFSLKKGSERGAYELVITVEETKPVFFDGNLGGVVVPSEQRRFTEDRVEWEHSETLGARLFAGSSGLAFATVSRGGDLQAGYTQYDLFGTGSFASLGISTDVDKEDFQGDTYAAAFTFGVPLSVTQSLRANLSWAESEIEGFEGESFTFEARRAGLEWRYDTTDDPLLPSRGVRVTAGVERSWFEQAAFLSPIDGLVTLEDTVDTVVVTGRKHWPLTQRQSIALGAGAGYQRTRNDEGFLRGLEYEATDLSAELVHSWSLWGFEKSRRIGDLWLETGVSYVTREQDTPFAPDFRTEAVTFHTGLVFRSVWGLIRASLSYTEFSGDGLSL
ncbi:MAG TPA: BamA/TamA family outer membrane protein [Thermoanaerobaculia bacterium]|nr:BamA/TamA family outer membrane protein [Thermoanaerobaculia bacterium]